MDDLPIRLNTIGLTYSDIDEKIESMDEIVDHVSSSYRLFRKTIKHLLLRDIRLYFNQETIQPIDELKNLFPRKGRRAEWMKFSNYLAFKVPSLKLTKISVILMTLIVVSVVALILWLIFGRTELLVHSILSNMPLISILVTSAIIPLGLLGWLGEIDLPGSTIDELMDEIISKNISDLLAGDKKRYKEIIVRE